MVKHLDKENNNTLLKANATTKEINQLCDEAISNEFASVSVNFKRISQVKKCLIGSKVKVGVVIGFPFGIDDTYHKLYEAEEALNNGVEEIDLVININDCKQGNYGSIKQELIDMRKLTQNHIFKVIIDIGSLNDQELNQVVQLAIEANVDFIKTIDFRFQSLETAGEEILESDETKKANGGILIIQRNN